MLEKKKKKDKKKEEKHKKEGCYQLSCCPKIAQRKSRAGQGTGEQQQNVCVRGRWVLR